MPRKRKSIDECGGEPIGSKKLQARLHHQRPLLKPKAEESTHTLLPSSSFSLLKLLQQLRISVSAHKKQHKPKTRAKATFQAVPSNSGIPPSITQPQQHSKYLAFLQERVQHLGGQEQRLGQLLEYCRTTAPLTIQFSGWAALVGWMEQQQQQHSTMTILHPQQDQQQLRSTSSKSSVQQRWRQWTCRGPSCAVYGTEAYVKCCSYPGRCSGRLHFRSSGNYGDDPIAWEQWSSGKPFVVLAPLARQHMVLQHPVDESNNHTDNDELYAQLLFQLTDDELFAAMHRRHRGGVVHDVSTSVDIINCSSWAQSIQTVCLPYSRNAPSIREDLVTRSTLKSFQELTQCDVLWQDRMEI